FPIPLSIPPAAPPGRKSKKPTPPVNSPPASTALTSPLPAPSTSSTISTPTRPSSPTSAANPSSCPSSTNSASPSPKKWSSTSTTYHCRRSDPAMILPSSRRARKRKPAARKRRKPANRNFPPTRHPTYQDFQKSPPLRTEDCLATSSPRPERQR